FMPGEYPSGRYAQRSAVADFNGDGYPDVATVFNILPRLSILFNRGNGFYGVPLILPAPDVSEAIATGDLDGDGDSDIVVGLTGQNYAGTGVAFYRNNGTGIFDNPLVFPTGGTGPTDVGLSDFNNDGRLDLVAIHNGNNTIGVLYNQGGGGFSAPVVLSCPDKPYQVATGDLNRDGWQDFVVVGGPFNSGSANWVRVFMNNGSGGFSSFVNYSPIFSGTRFYPCVALGDIDLDGDLDVVYANTGLRSSATSPYVVALLRNRGDGTLDAPTGISLNDFSGSCDALTLADVTGDGRLDILGTLGSNQGWIVLPSTGTGTFGAFRRYSVGALPHDVNSGDVDRDGDSDVVLTTWNSNEIGVYLNPGNGDFSMPTMDLGTGVLDSKKPLEIGDVNNDGKLDVVIGISDPLPPSSPRLRVYLGNGSGGFTLLQSLTSSAWIEDLDLKDMDNDGYLDVVFNGGLQGSPPTYQWGIFWNNRTGSFSSPVLFGPPNCGYALAEIETADLDNDGDLDVILPEDLGCPSIPDSARRLFIFENRGNRNFQLFSVLVVNPGPGDVKAGDLDRDGKMDLAIGHPWLDILWGNGDLTFSRTSIANLPISELGLADVNNDGNLDILAGLNSQDPYRESLAVILNNGNRTFQAPAIYLSSHDPNLLQINELVVGDGDQDGFLDVFLANYASSTISFFRNRGDGTFERYIGIGTGPNPLDVAFGDFTSDGAGDLIVLHSAFAPPAGQSKLLLLRGVGGWTPFLAEAFRLLRGRLISGGIPELQQSDDTYVVLWPGFVLNQAEAPVQLVVEGTAPRTPQGSLRCEVEARVNTSGLQQSIDLYNFSTNQWETKDVRSASTTDTLVTVEVSTNPAAYVDPVTRMVRVRVRWRAPGLVIIYPWEVRVDMVRFSLRG
ncbi:MAG: VCBS repeat-containing protein, partial [Fimbriimonadales bacterium]|nr:VCBS repeat-containing protein [Fimbriimonadales bacterium]